VRAFASGDVFFDLLTLLCDSIGLRRFFWIQICVFYLGIVFFGRFSERHVFLQKICIFNNFGPRKTLDLVESFRLTPASTKETRIARSSLSTARTYFKNNAFL
jgi:hypothetical protein